MDEEDKEQEPERRQKVTGYLYLVVSFVAFWMVLVSPGAFDTGGAHQGELGLLKNIVLYAFSFGFALSAYRLNRSSSIIRIYFLLMLICLSLQGVSLLFYIFL